MLQRGAAAASGVATPLPLPLPHDHVAATRRLLQRLAAAAVLAAAAAADAAAAIAAAASASASAAALAASAAACSKGLVADPPGPSRSPVAAELRSSYISLASYMHSVAVCACSEACVLNARRRPISTVPQHREQTPRLIADGNTHEKTQHARAHPAAPVEERARPNVSALACRIATPTSASERGCFHLSSSAAYASTPTTAPELRTARGASVQRDLFSLKLPRHRADFFRFQHAHGVSRKKSRTSAVDLGLRG